MFEKFWQLFGKKNRSEGKASKPAHHAHGRPPYAGDDLRPETRIQQLFDHGPAAEAQMLQFAQLVNEGADDETLYQSKIPLYRLLMQSVVYLPGEPGLAPAQPSAYMPDHSIDQPIGLVTLNSHAGDAGLPLFTRPQLVYQWSMGQLHPIQVPFRWLCSQAVQAGVDFLLINPGGSFNNPEQSPTFFEVSAFDFCYLAEGILPPRYGEHENGITLREEAEIALGLPDGPVSPMLMERLTGLFTQNMRLVEAAYAFEVSIDQGPPHLGIGIRMPDGAEDCWETELLPNTLAISQEVLGDKEYIDFFFLNEVADMEHTLESMTQPFFRARAS